jgi:hypothetical protein
LSDGREVRRFAGIPPKLHLPKPLKIRIIPAMRTKATLFSFLLVFSMYLVYGWVLVPLVLPTTIGIRPPPPGDEDDKIRAEIAHLLELFPEGDWERDRRRKINLLRFVEMGKETIVLFEKDTPNGKRLTLEPCTIVFLSDAQEPVDGEEAENENRRSVVIRTQRSAEIEFDRDFVPGKMAQPKMLSSCLWGKVTIKSIGEDPGKHDNFSLETEDVRITESPGLTRIEALKDVRFTFGFHTGTGNKLTLDLTPSDLNQQHSEKELSSATFQTLKSLRLVLPENPDVPAKLSGDGYVPDGPAATIDVHCNGQFVFAANPAEQNWTADFFEKVEMVRKNTDNTVDQLTADKVRLMLKPIEGTSAGNKTSHLDRIEPALFIAEGKAGRTGQPVEPARLSVKQGSDVTLIGDQIIFDLRENSLILSTRQGPGASPVVEMIVAEQYTIQSEHFVQYTLGQNGAFGKFVSQGKGNMTGKTGEGASAKDINLTWNEMQMEPHPLVKDQIVLHLNKGIFAQMNGFGTMTADELMLCFNFAPTSPTPAKSAPSKLPGAALSGTGGQKSQLVLDHAIVKDRNRVVFKTASGECHVKQLQIHFTNVTPDGRILQSLWMPQMLTVKPPTPPDGTVRPARTFASSQTIRQVQHSEPLSPLNPLTPMPSVQLYPPAPTASAPAYGSNIVPTPQMGSAPATPTKGFVETQNLLGIKSSPNGGKFEMTGDLMRMRVRIQNGQSAAEVVAVEGNVHLKEKFAGSVPNTAIDITGDTVTIWDPAEPTTQINISGHATGSDAVFKGKGVELRSRELNISRPDNKFWTDVPGRLVANTGQLNVPAAQTADGRRQTAADNLAGTLVNDKLTVEWNTEMVCDGLVLHFGRLDRKDSRVQTEYQAKTLLCDRMEIQLKRKVMLFEPEEPTVIQILCAGDVRFRERKLNDDGKQQSNVTARVEKLYYNVEGDFFNAEGPGELSMMFLGTGQGFGKNNLAGNLAGTPGNANNPKPNGDSLTYLAVWFRDAMQGTLRENNKIVDIKGRVRAAYCPAKGWEDVINQENFGVARRTGYTLECDLLRTAEVPNPTNLSQSSMELTASDSAIIEGVDGLYGRAKTIKYNQAKSMVHLDTNVVIQTATSQTEIRGQSIRYNIETGAVEMTQTQFGLGL